MGKADRFMIKNYITLIRPEEWVLTGFVLVIGYILAGNVSLTHANSIVIAFLSFFSIGAFGFIINDYFDREYDKKKAKNRNPISKKYIRKESAIVLASIFGITGLAVSYFLIPQVFILFLLPFMLLILYSAQPFRFKEKPFLDITIDSLPMPILFLIGYTLFGNVSFPAFLIALELFLLGLTRGIIQEIRDYNADKKSGFYTTVIRVGVKNSLNLLRIIFISFIAMCFFTIILFFPIYFIILILSLYPYIQFIFSDNLRPNISSKKLNEINHKSHIILIFLTLLTAVFLYFKIY
mgnify:CR=1 FL=1